MKQGSRIGLAVFAAATLAVGAAWAAGGGTWVSSDGNRFVVDGRDASFHEDGTEFSLDSLADGETRVIGVGERAVTATRSGDQVTITRAGAGNREALDMTCTVGRDDCRIITFDDDPEKVLVVVQKHLSCENGVGDCAAVDVMALDGHFQGDWISKAHGEGGAHVIRIRKSVECDDDGNCEAAEELIQDGEGVHDIMIKALGDVHSIDHPGAMVFLQKDDGKVTLRCPEGDTTMRVQAEEAEDVFLCPKHSTPLEKAKGPARVHRRIKLGRED